MPEFKSGRTLIDYLGAFELGMNSGQQPLLLPKNQLAFAFNSTVRGGFATTRPPFTKMLTMAWESPLVQAAVEGGLFQGACYYKPDSGPQALIAQISGRLYQFSITGNVVTVTDITIPGDPNPSTTTQAWLWQAERWVIVNDGVSLPVFYDGVSSRRSYGPSRVIVEGTPSAADVPPIGSGIVVNLTGGVDYPGPYNVPVLFNGAYYQASANTSGYKVKLTTVYDTSSIDHPAGSDVVIQPGVVGYMTASSGYSINTTSWPAEAFSFVFTLSTPYTGAIGSYLSITGSETDGTYTFVNGTTVVWKVKAISGNTITVTNKDALYSGPRTIVGFSYPVGTAVQVSGSSQPNVSLGLTSATVPIGPAGTEVELYLTQLYVGVSGQIVYINGGQYTIEAVAEEATTGTVVLINLSDEETTYPGAPDAQDILSVPELPAGRMGAYVMTQNWVSLPDGLRFIVSDASRGPSGTVAYEYRDAVLKTVDLTFRGGAFSVPESGAYITSIKAVPKLDESLGQGPVQVGTSKGVFSGVAPFDFTNPPPSGTPLLPQILIGFGPLSQNSTALVNSDVFFRCSEGYASLIQGRRDFTSWGNTTISEEVNERILDRDDETLLAYGSAVVFDNRFVGTVSPQVSNSGVFHAGVVVINLDPVSSLRGKSESVYDGLWTGLNILQLVSGDFDNENRAFSFGFNVDTTKIELYEILPTAEANRFDNGYIPVSWGFESAAVFNSDIKDPHELIKLMDGELAIDNVLGRVRVQVWYKFDQGCWTNWADFFLCADVAGNPQSYPRIGLGRPELAACNEPNNLNGNDGYTLQVRVQITGSCRFLRGRFKATTLPTQEFATPICAESECVSFECDNVFNDLTIYNLQSNIVFNADSITVNVPCPDGWSCGSNLTVTFPPGTLVLPDPDNGTYSALTCEGIISSTSAEVFFRLLAESVARCDAVSEPPGDWNPPMFPPSPDNQPQVSLSDLTSESVCLGGVFSATFNAVSNDSRAVTFSVISGSLPTGMTLNSSGKTATISGTAGAVGTFTFTVRVTDLRGATSVRTYTIYVAEIAQDSLPDGETGVAYSQTLTVDGPTTGAETWQVTSGALPDGLSLNSSTGAITGTPTVSGDYTFIICFSNGL